MTKLRNFPPWQVMKDERAEFNHCIMRMAAVVDETAQAHKVDGNKHLWDDYGKGRNHLMYARTGDHGKKLIARLRTRLETKCRLRLRIWGLIPRKMDKDWKLLIGRQQPSRHRLQACQDFARELKVLYEGFYEAKTADGKTAREHRAVNRSYKKTVDRARKCR